ncbi:hypothetical protein BRC68_04535 [Halobacteriales archaeon QH_6_64_20]|nr:MAG: hypothetical protein BRC68_04535 [Halobacteriales archaeon QH_6_64_20]
MDDATAEADGDNGSNNDGDGRDAGTEVETNGITARYHETDAERLLEFDADGATAVIAQNREGYAMLTVRRSATGNELERVTFGNDLAGTNTNTTTTVGVRARVLVSGFRLPEFG